ncbi:endonuclease [Sulfodiicoccus acidiphilus]|uniref:Crossover junction endodeoxyribonuclease Hjc n=1 Tax=Sulfodiicoccus acidiphilus TaxID=1670455 RepID=A0A348B751_9CREN|nr:Holliday junction resolvase Hjc [Sulfodiicoccus acidiphilus]BBD74003.1 endonuclease [Sulfodiicoccus acidiphilus]GGT87233.1 endonuclease [Sulfodiicoccus acidiphilus]
MSERKRRGSTVERYIVNRLTAKGFACLRAPASGSKRKQPVPDIVALKDGVIIIIEVKSRASEENIYVNRDQAEGITKFSERSGGELFLAIKSPSGIRFLDFSKLRQTRGGNFVADKNLISSGMSLEDLVRHVESKLVKKLDLFA